MKTKNKMIVMLEMAIVLCSLFLVALPAIAAEQNTQKLSANTITATSEDDFVLDIYGNANEDDTIDMRDLTYVKLIFFGKKPETELADAKYDGKINPLDFIQIKLIIVGKEKELTIIDGRGKTKTFKLPIKRIIAMDDGQGEPLRVLGAEDLVVGVSGMKGHEIFLPEMSKMPSVGGQQPDYEKVLSLKPDLFFTFSYLKSFQPDAEEKLEPHGVQVLRLDCLYPTVTNVEGMIKLGYLVGMVDKTKEFVDFHERIMDNVKSRTEGLSEDEKPQVYIEVWKEGWTCTKGTKHDQVCNMAGGVNIARDISGGGTEGYYPVVDSEWVLEQNPDIIIKTTFGGDWGYETDDPSEMKEVREKMMNRPGWRNIKAVKNGDVYIVSGDFSSSGLQGFLWAAYMAKEFHPDLFEDLNPEAIHQEHIDRFLRIDYNLDKHGVFVYPEPS